MKLKGLILTADQNSIMLLPLLTILLFCSLGLAEQPVSKEKEVSGLCPDHWIDGTLSGLGCLYFNSSTTANWEEAANWCQHPDNDASLVEISSELQLDFVRGELIFLQENGITNHWWTGGTDLGREGSWFWITSLATLGDFVWSSSQPTGGTSFNCLWFDENLDFLGNDAQCADGEYFICQRK